MEVLIFLAIGALAGFLGSKLFSGASKGLLVNMIVGIIGGMLGGWLSSSRIRVCWHHRTNRYRHRRFYPFALDYLEVQMMAN